MTISRLQQQRDITVLQLLSTLPAHPYDLERQLFAMGIRILRRSLSYDIRRRALNSGFSRPFLQVPLRS